MRSSPAADALFRDAVEQCFASDGVAPGVDCWLLLDDVVVWGDNDKMIRQVIREDPFERAKFVNREIEARYNN